MNSCATLHIVFVVQPDNLIKQMGYEPLLNALYFYTLCCSWIRWYCQLELLLQHACIISGLMQLTILRFDNRDKHITRAFLVPSAAYLHVVSTVYTEVSTYRDLGRDESTTKVVMFAFEVFGTKLWGTKRNQHVRPQPVSCR